MPAPTPRTNGQRRNGRERNEGDSPPDFKHYAIMGSLMAGPPILVIVVFLALYAGRSGPVEAEPQPAETDTYAESSALTLLQERQKEASRQVLRLIESARSLHERSKRQFRLFYEHEEDEKKMAAWKEAERILRMAQRKLEEAGRADKFTKHDMAIQDLKTMVDRDLHNILKDKPLFLDEE